MLNSARIDAAGDAPVDGSALAVEPLGAVAKKRTVVTGGGGRRHSRGGRLLRHSSAASGGSRRGRRLNLGLVRRVLRGWRLLCTKRLRREEQGNQQRQNCDATNTREGEVHGPTSLLRISTQADGQPFGQTRDLKKAAAECLKTDRSLTQVAVTD